MKVGYITTVKDEGDIIYWNLLYHRQIGIRDFYIIDNNSKDTTIALIFKFKEKYKDCNVYVESDMEIGYWQYKRINKLANMAFVNGCKWIIPLDADEFIFQEGNENFNITDWLNSLPEGDYLSYRWCYYRIHPEDSYSEENPIFRITHRDIKKSMVQKKIILRYKPHMTISQGNHQLHEEENYREILGFENNVSLAHYSIRGPEHIVKKTQNLGKAYIAIKDKLFYHESIDDYNKYIEQPLEYISSKVSYEYGRETERNYQIQNTLLRAIKNEI